MGCAATSTFADGNYGPIPEYRSFGPKGTSNVGVPEHLDQVFRVKCTLNELYHTLIFTKCALYLMCT